MPNISVMIFTLNEELNLPYCLESLKDFDDVVVIDSFSTDGTKNICNKFTARFVEHKFTGFGDQRNWALDNVDIKYDWILILDADERVTDSLTQEISRAVESSDDDIVAYRLKRRFILWNSWLKHSSLYPTWVVRLIKKGHVRFVNRGHAETQEINGSIGMLRQDLLDENRKGLDSWFERQNQYSSKEAIYELGQKNSISILNILSFDPLQRRSALKSLANNIPGRPFIYFLYAYFLRGGILDGKKGFMFCYMKAIYQAMICIKKYEIQINEAVVDNDEEQ